MNRRQFLRSTGAGAISLTAFPHHLFAADKKKFATDRILLGPRNEHALVPVRFYHYLQ